MKTFEEVLPLINHPSRYINSEWNSIHKNSAGKIKVCLCFPDLYELGASNIGLGILYHIINSREDSLAERVYSPDEDLIQIMYKENIPLVSLESFTPVRDFDIVGFSLQYELCLTNVLTILDLAKIPIFSNDRQENLLPVVIAGGPVCSNPEIVADFFDAVVLGDGEEVINEIIDTVLKFKGQNEKLRKVSLLSALAQIPGIYVPSFYDVIYKPDGRISQIKPLQSNLPQKIQKRTVNLRNVAYPTKPIVPYVQTVHNRLTVEISRGCIHNCLFCQAGRIYSPWRERSPEQIINIIQEGLLHTGYEEVSLASFAGSDYSQHDTLFDNVSKICTERKVLLSIPSLRCDKAARELLKRIYPYMRGNLTLAPETGTERLRKVIHKKISNEDIVNTVYTAYRLGWRNIKLYFMIGLPTETEEDILSIITLVKYIRKKISVGLTVAISLFVPKPHTPFQWVSQEKFDTMVQKKELLYKGLGKIIKGASLESWFLESIFSRGDRRLCKVVYKAWCKGCRFDQWKEKLQIKLWQEAFAEAGIEPEMYTHRTYSLEDVLPWEHVDFGQNKKALYELYIRAVNSLPASANTCITFKQSSCAIEDMRKRYFNTLSRKAVQRIRLRVGRAGKCRFLSHLEQIDLFRRTLRRADLPIVYTQGYHPQMKISFGPAISVGYESQAEYLDVELFHYIDLREIAKRLIFPEGYRLLAIKNIPLFFPALEASVNLVEYSIEYLSDGFAPDAINEQNGQPKVQRVMSQERFYVEKCPGEIIDVKPLLKEMHINSTGITMVLRFGPKHNIKPEKIIQTMFNLDTEQVKQLKITRMKLLTELTDGTIKEL